MRSWASAVLVLAGCGRVAFDSMGDARTSGADVSLDTVNAVDAVDALSSSLIVWYPFSAIVGDVALDATGNGHDALCASRAPAGTCPTIISDTRGLVAQFDGGGDLMLAPSDALLSAIPTFTITAWIKVPAIGPMCVASKRFGAANANTWQLCLNGDASVSFFTDDGGTNVITTPPALVQVSTWQFIAVRHDLDATTKTLFVDSAVLASGSSLTLQRDAGDIVLGGDIDAATPLAAFAGEIDDFRLSDASLSDALIAALAAE